MVVTKAPVVVEHPPRVALGTRADRWQRNAWRVAYVLFALQLVGMSIWSAVLYSRFSVTNDGGQYLQGLYLITHGQFIPFSSVHGFALWRDHFTLAWWPISLVELIPPHGLFVYWVQDAALVGAEIAALRWANAAVSAYESRSEWEWWPAALTTVGAIILVANPWTYTAMSFDIHIETFACPFIVLAAYDFSQGRSRRAWLWVAAVLSFGDVTATWVIGLGISAALAAVWQRGRHFLRTGVLLGGAGAMWLAIVTAVGGNKGSVFSATFGYLVSTPGRPGPTKLTTFGLLRGLAQHPNRLLTTLWQHRVNATAAVAPTGWIGLFTPWTFGVPAVVLLENNAGNFASSTFSAPGFQAAPVYPFAAVGLLVILAWLGAHRLRRFPTVLAAITVVVLVNAVFWAAVWIPPVKGTWLRISAAQASVLAAVGRQIPSSDEVIASQGIVGRFYARSQLYDIFGGDNTIKVVGHTVWFIIVPNSGIETQPVDAALGAIAQLAGPMHATLVSSSAGVWAFRWERPASVHTVTFAAEPATIPAWVAAGTAGTVELQGPESQWGVETNGRPGYLVQNDYWRRGLGHYLAGLAVATAVPLTVEVWDDNGYHLLARTEVPPTDTDREVLLPFDVTQSFPPIAAYGGWGPFRIQTVRPANGQVLEVRVFTDAGGLAKVYSITLLAR
jgi:hypothetical protein